MSHLSACKFLLFLLLICSFGCRKELNKPTWNVDTFFPIAYGTFSTEQIVDDLIVDENGNLHIAFTNQVYELALDSLLTLPDTTVQNSISLPFGIIPPNQILPYATDTQETTYGIPNGAALREVRLKAGTMSFSVSSTLAEDVVMTYMLPGALKDGDTLKIVETIPSGGIISVEKDLTGYTLDLSGQSGALENTMTAIYYAHTTATSDTLILNINDKITYQYDLKGMQIAYARGYFGQLTETINESIDSIIPIPAYVSGSFGLSAVDLTLSVRNYLGVDFSGNLNAINTSNTTEGLSGSLAHAMIGQTGNYSRAFDNNGSVTPFETSFTFNETNSNLNDILGIIPDELNFNMDINLNPNGNVSGHQDFFYCDKALAIELNGEIPLSVSANNLVLQDTLPYEMEFDTVEVGIIYTGELQIHFDNSLPFTLTPDLKILSDSGSIVTTLVGDQQPITANNTSTVRFPINNELIAKLSENTKMLLRLTLNSPLQEETYLQVDDQISFRIVGQITPLIQF